MKTVVQGLVAFAAVFVVGNAAHGLTFTANGQGNDANEILSGRATSGAANPRLVIPLSNTAIFGLKNGADTLTATFSN